jgi:glycosyltransferase involved in cell wall biosynthesis
MNIMMMSNVYTPFVGGVRRSVETLTSELRKKGHRVLIVTPDFEKEPPDEPDVIRVPAIHHYNGSEFSVQIPLPGLLHAALKNFTPDIIHSHHPFMLGDTALRISAEFDTPIVFTHHTFYENYTHYVKKNSSLLKTFIKTLATEYANLCNLVIAPSKSVADTLHKRGVSSPMKILPTGIDIDAFRTGNRRLIRTKYAIPDEAFVLGFVSRIAPEKNIRFLSAAIKDVMRGEPRAYFLVVGNGPSVPALGNYFSRHGLSSRLVMTGILQGQELIDAYHAMDLFVFASQTETQGLVLVEAMASGIPVVAVEGPAIKDVIVDFKNGRIVSDKVAHFINACNWYIRLNDSKQKQIIRAAVATAQIFSKEYYGRSVLNEYQQLINNKPAIKSKTPWQKIKKTAVIEFELLKIFAKAMEVAIRCEHI